MSGLDAQRGFSFQSLVLIRRLVDDVLLRRARMIEGADDLAPRKFRIEAPALTRPNVSRSTPAPAWDLVEEVGDEIIVDEVKSGRILTAQDRWSFWVRIRATAANATRSTRITSRLTISASMRSRIYWDQRCGDVPWPECMPASVHSPESALAEARFILTASNASLRAARPTLPRCRHRPLTRATARRLTQVAIDRVPVHETLEASILRDLGDATDPEIAPTLLAWLQGKTTSLAVRGSQHVDAMTFAEESSYVRRLLTVPRQAIRDWRLLSKKPSGARTPVTGNLSMRPWREVQPSLTRCIDRGADDDLRLVMLLGHGGLGKSVLLEQLAGARDHSEMVARIDGNTFKSPRVERALDLGAWLAAYHRKSLTIIVDQLDERRDLIELVHAITRVVRASPHAQAFAGLRPTSASLLDEGGGWHRVELEPWPVEAVQALAPNAPPDLVEVLRTPLLLELYLDLAATDTHVTEIAADRASVISTWLAARVLPRGHRESPRRRDVIAACVGHVQRGEKRWTLGVRHQMQATKLAGLGLLRIEIGRFLFRHALLRDAAAAMIFASDGDEHVLARRIASCFDAVVRHDILRVAVESAMSPVGLRAVGIRLDLDRLLDASITAGLTVASVLGETTVRTETALEVVLAHVELAELLESARAARNHDWLNVIAAHDLIRPTWLRREDAFAQLYGLIYASEGAGYQAAVRVALAERVRAWATPEDATVPWNAAVQLGRMVARALPDEATLRWLDSFDGRFPMFLAEVRDLGRRARRELPVDAYTRLFLSSTSVSEDGACSEDDLFMLVTLSGEAGVLESQPRAGARILFEMSLRAVLIEENRGGLTDDTATFLVQAWEPHNAWSLAWNQLRRVCVRPDVAAAVLQEATRSRSLAARMALLAFSADWADPSIADRLLLCEDLYRAASCDLVVDDAIERRRPSLSDGGSVDKLLGLRSARTPRETPQVRSVRRASSWSAPQGLPPPIDQELLDKIDLDARPATRRDLVLIVARDGLRGNHRRLRSALTEWIDRWPVGGSLDAQVGRATFIESCVDEMTRTRNPDVDAYVELATVFWRVWRSIDERAKHLGSGMKLGWFIYRLEPARREPATRRLTPLIESIVSSGSGNDLRALAGDITYSIVVGRLVSVVLEALLRRIDAERAARSDGWVPQGIEYLAKKLIAAPSLRGTDAERLLGVLDVNPWIHDSVELRRRCLQRARALAS